MNAENKSILTAELKQAVQTIKGAILQSQSRAARMISGTQLSLYFGVGLYVSANSRKGTWGTGAIKVISEQLRRELPGLRGFSEESIKKMRMFAEFWSQYLNRSPMATELTLDSARESITHDYKAGIPKPDHTAPNNFPQTMSSTRQAMKAIRMFKDEYLLDYINVEDIDAQEKDVDERLVEQRIIHNIKRFIMTLGRDFTFVGNQYHLEIYDEEMWSDLLFFNRELNALVAIELKVGKFKPAYLGQLYAYLQVLDDKVRKPHENPSIGIVLCKSANQAYAEYAVRDYNKPMGVSTYKTFSDMPKEMQDTLPDIEELKKLMDE